MEALGCCVLCRPSGLLMITESSKPSLLFPATSNCLVDCWADGGWCTHESGMLMMVDGTCIVLVVDILE